MALEIFPTENACIVREGFSIIQPAANRYLGTSTFTYFAKFKCTIHITTPEDLEAFGNWWHNSINGGADAFYITLGYYTTPKEVAVKFATDMKFSISKGIFVMQAEMQAQEAIHAPL